MRSTVSLWRKAMYLRTSYSINRRVGNPLRRYSKRDKISRLRRSSPHTRSKPKRRRKSKRKRMTRSFTGLRTQADRGNLPKTAISYKLLKKINPPRRDLPTVKGSETLETSLSPSRSLDKVVPTFRATATRRWKVGSSKVAVGCRSLKWLSQAAEGWKTVAVYLRLGELSKLWTAG